MTPSLSSTTKTSLPVDGKRYTASVEEPEEGYTAFFVELVYDSGFEHPFKFTTDVNIVPDGLPFDLDGVTEIELK